MAIEEGWVHDPTGLPGGPEFRRVAAMSLLDLLLLLVIAGICGAIGRGVGGGFSKGGCLVSIAIGFIGALLGLWLARQMGLPELFTINLGGTAFPIVWSILGGAIFVALLGLIGRLGKKG